MLLNDMGRDGAHGMSVLHAAGAHTIAQDGANSLVHGMPGAAIEPGAAVEILNPLQIIRALHARASEPE